MLGENIRALRKARGLSQQELAERLHVVRQTVSKWEQGLSVPDADMLVRLAECLEVSVEELLGAPKPESTAPLEPQAVLADKLSALTGQLAEQNHRRRRFWKWVAIAAGICGLLLLPQLVLTLLMLGYGLPANSSIGIIGGGPGGLSAAYFLSLMGHQVVVYDQRPKLGGMLRYGIPDYRLPQDKLDADIDFILSTGIEVHTGVSIGRDISFAEIENQYDAVYISIGAHNDKKIGIPGEDAVGVHSAVQLLRDIGEGRVPDFKGKRVCVIGGGNVSMDATRTAIRLGASAVTCVYRRRVTDMTALAEEIEEAQSEGCQILSLQAPDHIETDETGRVTALWTRPQVIGAYGKDGRPRPYDADQPLLRTPCDVVIVAIGQSIDAKPFEQIAPVVRGKIQAESDAFVPNTPHVFAGGDAVTGPATVIRAVAAGKVAAANIDAHLGFRHVIKSDVEIPAPHLTNMPACGRIELRSRPAEECVGNFDLVKCGMTEQEVHQETSRCLRCDHFGYGIFKGGRSSKW